MKWIDIEQNKFYYTLKIDEYHQEFLISSRNKNSTM